MIDIPYPPTTHFRVLKECSEFKRDFQVTHATQWVCTLIDSDSQVSTLSPLVIGMRLRDKHIEVVAYPAHPSHRMHTVNIDIVPIVQCSHCMIRIDEAQITWECPLTNPVEVTTQPGPQLEVKDGPGPSSRNHPWRK